MFNLFEKKIIFKYNLMHIRFFNFVNLKIPFSGQGIISISASLIQEQDSSMVEQSNSSPDILGSNPGCAH